MTRLPERNPHVNRRRLSGATRGRKQVDRKGKEVRCGFDGDGTWDMQPYRPADLNILLEKFADTGAGYEITVDVRISASLPIVYL